VQIEAQGLAPKAHPPARYASNLRDNNE